MPGRPSAVDEPARGIPNVRETRRPEGHGSAPHGWPAAGPRWAIFAQPGRDNAKGRGMAAVPMGGRVPPLRDALASRFPGDLDETPAGVLDLLMGRREPFVTSSRPTHGRRATCG